MFEARSQSTQLERQSIENMFKQMQDVAKQAGVQESPE